MPFRDHFWHLPSCPGASLTRVVRGRKPVNSLCYGPRDVRCPPWSRWGEKRVDEMTRRSSKVSTKELRACFMTFPCRTPRFLACRRDETAHSGSSAVRSWMFRGCLGTGSGGGPRKLEGLASCPRLQLHWVREPKSRTVQSPQGQGPGPLKTAKILGPRRCQLWDSTVRIRPWPLRRQLSHLSHHKVRKHLR